MSNKQELAIQTAQNRLKTFHADVKKQILEIGKLIENQFPEAPEDITDYHMAHLFGEITRSLNHWTISLNKQFTEINSQTIKTEQNETETPK